MGTRLLGASAWATVVLLAVEIAVAVALSATGSVRSRKLRESRDVSRLLVRQLGLTDLALSSGTSYTRHPSQSDLFAPHNEHPSAIEHFPAGSVFQPPAAPPGASSSTAQGAAP